MQYTKGCLVMLAVLAISLCCYAGAAFAIGGAGWLFGEREVITAVGVVVIAGLAALAVAATKRRKNGR